MTPSQIVAELDKYIVGQAAAKRAVAIALRNRYRRRLLGDDLRDEVIPKNILMIGPTGVGKTEIARRLATLARAPFIKVEATKFTEVGYVGRDVDSMVRDLLQVALRLVEAEKLAEVREKAEERAAERIVDILQPLQPSGSRRKGQQKRRVARHLQCHTPAVRAVVQQYAPRHGRRGHGAEKGRTGRRGKGRKRRTGGLAARGTHWGTAAGARPQRRHGRRHDRKSRSKKIRECPLCRCFRRTAWKKWAWICSRRWAVLCRASKSSAK